jgi:hypothetical protein
MSGVEVGGEVGKASGESFEVEVALSSQYLLLQGRGLQISVVLHP